MSENKKSQNSNEGKGGKKTAWIIILAVIILVLIGIIVYLVIPKEPEEEERRNVVVTPDNVQEVLEQMSSNPEELTPVGYYTVTMNYDWHFTSGDAVSSDAYIENDPSNSTAVYVDVFKTDDPENAIYKSPVIPLGGHLENISLDEKLDPGTYDCIAVINMVDDDQNVLDRLRVTVTITIEN